MSLEKILARIRLAGEQQAAEIVRKAEEEASTLLEQARLNATEVYQNGFQEAQLPAESECFRIINEAHFKASCIVGQAREDFIDRVLASLRQRLSHVRESEGYARVMRRLLSEVLPEANGKAPLDELVQLEADPRDRELLKRLLEETGLDVEVACTLESLGGVNACSAGRRTHMKNTIDSRLEQALPYLRYELALRFEEHTANTAEPLLAHNRAEKS